MPLPKDLQAAINKANKDFGEHTIVLASDIRPLERISSGSLALDAALGGGWPSNQWTELIGEASHGKTGVLHKTVAHNQSIDPNFVATWIASEWYDAEYARMCGVDTSRVVVVNENIMENAFTLALRALDERWGDALVIDSLPAMTPGEEAEKAMEEFTVGLAARLTNKFLRKQGSAGRRSMVDPDDRACTCFIVNQWRDKIGVMFGDPRTTFGGKQLPYTAVVRAEITRDEWITAGGTGKKVKVGQTIKLKTMKNKSFPPYKVGTVDFYFEDTDGHPAGSYDRFKEIVGLGVVYDIIQQNSSWYEYAGVKGQGLNGMMAALAEDLEVADTLAKEVLDVALKKPNAPVGEIPDIPAEEPKKQTVARRPKRRTTT